jgi:signal transduction histidine kinase
VLFRSIIIVDMAVFIFYVVIPNRFVFQALPSLVFSIGEVALLTLTFGSPFDMPDVVTALASLAFANIVAALSSLQLHSYRWRIFQNWTERKDTDRLVAIGQTAGMIGHDIRNPLQAIVSELYIAKEAIANTPHLEEKTLAMESIDLIEEQTDYISKIVSDLQDYARPIKPEIKEVDLAKLVVSIFQTVKVPDKVFLKVDVQGFPNIQTDPTLIRRAITNLVNNALQAMPTGGTLELCAVKTEDKTIISVTDTGQGIPEEIKPKLFTPLVTTKAKGQGLGLAVVKRLVEALGGSITFESEVGKGTTFTISLPQEKITG